MNLSEVAIDLTLQLINVGVEANQDDLQSKAVLANTKMSSSVIFTDIKLKSGVVGTETDPQLVL